MVKNLPAVQETWVQSLGQEDQEGNGYPLQYFCLENFIDRGAWWATVHWVAKSQTQLSDFQFHMVLNVNRTYCGDRTAVYTNTESLHCTPEMNIMLRQLYLNKKKKLAQETFEDFQLRKK